MKIGFAALAKHGKESVAMKLLTGVLSVKNMMERCAGAGRKQLTNAKIQAALCVGCRCVTSTRVANLTGGGSMSKSLADEYPKEQERCRELLAAYNEIPQGAFGAAAISAVLKEADEAALSGDAVRILIAFNAMVGCE